MSKVLILSQYADEFQELIEAAHLPGVERMVASKDASAAFKQGKEFDVVFGEPVLIARVLPEITGLRWVQSIWAGVEPLLASDLRRDYQLSNARGVFGGLMSEFVFGYLLMHERRILQRMQAQKDCIWDETVTGTLRGKTIGLLGVGSIGAHLAATAKHFGMNVRGYTRSSEACVDVDTYFHAEGLKSFAEGLDFLIAVLPNTRHTRRIVDADLLLQLPSSAVFINVGRGAVVDETALLEALRNGRLALAVLDVFEQEPLPPNHRFWRTPNLIMTFHTSAPSFPIDLSRVFIENYQRFVAGLPLLYTVDFEREY